MSWKRYTDRECHRCIVGKTWLKYAGTEEFTPLEYYCAQECDGWMPVNDESDVLHDLDESFRVVLLEDIHKRESYGGRRARRQPSLKAMRLGAKQKENEYIDPFWVEDLCDHIEGYLREQSRRYS